LQRKASEQRHQRNAHRMAWITHPVQKKRRCTLKVKLPVIVEDVSLRVRPVKYKISGCSHHKKLMHGIRRALYRQTKSLQDCRHAQLLFVVELMQQDHSG